MSSIGRPALALVLVGQAACTTAFDPVEADLSGFGGATQATPECVDAVAGGVAYRACASLENYADAASACALWGGTLVMLDSEREEQAVTDFAFSNGTANYWLGATDLVEEGVWRWSDGRVFWSQQQVPEGMFAHWFDGEPNNAASPPASDEDCAYMYRRWGWNDADCSRERPYVCEAPWSGTRGSNP